MKKGLIIGLIVVVGGTLLLYPLFKKDEPPVKEGPPVVFAFKGNLGITSGEVVELKARVEDERTKSVSLLIDEKELESWDNPEGAFKFYVSSEGITIGAHHLKLVATMEDGTVKTESRLVRILSDIRPERWVMEIVKQFDHNPESFTQGLAFYKGKFFEGTGDPGKNGTTLVAEVDLQTGKHNRHVKLGPVYFGEGITLMNDELFQLTWQSGKCFVYNVNDFLKIKREFQYTGEGWGLCNDGTHLIMSDGTERIAFRDPETFNIERTIEVYNQKGPIIYLNELEYMDGLIFANVWTTDAIIAIDPETGKVVREIDAREIAKQGRGDSGEVMNGIARNPETGKTYVTGKYWPKLFEVKFSKY